MQDATSLAADLSPLLPLLIRRAEVVSGINLSIGGDAWSLNVMADWAWQRSGVVVADADQPDAADAVWDLCGLDLLAVHFPDPECSGDCSFILSDGSLDVRSDRTGWESWTLQHDSLHVVYVGL
jgi:hypothetical protein